MRQRGWTEHEQAESQRGGKPPQAQGRPLGGQVHRRPRPRDGQGHLQERPWQDPGRDDDQAESGKMVPNSREALARQSCAKARFLPCMGHGLGQLQIL